MSMATSKKKILYGIENVTYSVDRHADLIYKTTFLIF